MLKVELHSLPVGPELRTRIEPPIFAALFGHVQRFPPRRRGRQSPTLTVTQAKQILELTLPRYRDSVATALDATAFSGPLVFKQIGELVHRWIFESVKFLRREGATQLRELQKLADERKRAAELWRMLFRRRFLALVQGSGLLEDPVQLESCDLAVESLRLWVDELARQVGRFPPGQFSPSTFFLDAEADLEGVIEWQGHTLHLRGRPDAVVLNPDRGRAEICEYKFGLQGQLELQVAQVLLYLRLLNVVKGEAAISGRLDLFRVVPDLGEETDKPTEPSHSSEKAAEFPDRVQQAFAGYIGNAAAVRRIKIECAMALKEGTPPRMPINLMFCGPGGLGKTELARRVARALDLPLVDIPAGSIKDVDELVKRIDETLKSHGLEASEDGTDSGLPRLKYPPLVIFLDEVHELRRQADKYLNMFEPKEKRAVCNRRVGDFRDATILGATTDKGLLPGPFLTRFRIIDLEPYSAEDIAAIVQPVFAGKTVDAAFLIDLAQRARLNPRIAIEQAKEMLTHHRFNPQHYPLTVKGLQSISADTWLVDQYGISRNERAYLQALQSGPKGINALVALLPVGREEVVNVIEPYLLHLGAIRRTGNGRELTERGRVIAA